jgi:uncharacterized protein
VDATLADFIRVLRSAGVRISVAESIDAHRAVRRVGLTDRGLLKSALRMTLAKSDEEAALVDGAFERFFSFQNLAAEGGLEDSPEAPAAERQLAGASRTGGGHGGERAEGVRPEAVVEAGPLAQQLLAQVWADLEVEIAAAGHRVGSSKIVSFTQRGRFTMAIADELGMRGLNHDIGRLAAGTDEQKAAAAYLERSRSVLLERIRDHVERQVGLFANPEDRRLLRERLPHLKLAAVDPHDFQQVQELVRRMAKRLVTLHVRRRKAARRGQLDVPRTVRGALAYDGIPFEPRWRRVKKDQPRIMALCDVSGSVATVSGFLLMFLYSVNTVLPKVRSFAFSDSLQEVTDLFQALPLEEAVAVTQRRLGDRSSDYGRSLRDFEQVCLEDIDYRTSVIVLGDARSNYGDPGHASLRRVYQRARRVIWLNPEPRSQWGYGDSEMPLLATACHHTRVCNTLKHLEQLVEELMRA